ncbi:hypothetical protein IWQ60_005448 [Tieghemiomyces parasiticus]|uniref:Uncharacterized protein n=1 Tax=Tieghemiomyces parasiticus TaxID=78921 RepID=A0A9W8A6Z1_9FUNG|nr:hypothetical protein IWQ60_005448 [Tieghemiomyces parasiticus]
MSIADAKMLWKNLNWTTLAKFIEENYCNKRWIEALDKLQTKGNLFKNLTPEAATTRACDFMHGHAPLSLGNTGDLATIDLEPHLQKIAAAIKANRAFATVMGTNQHPSQPVQAARAVNQPQASQIKPMPASVLPLPASGVPQVESNSSNAHCKCQLESLRLKNKELQAKLDALTQLGNT